MWYRMSNRHRGFISQITNKESRTWFYAAMVNDLTMVQAPSTSDSDTTQSESLPEDEEDTHSSSDDHYWMSKKHATSRDLGQWLMENDTDRALSVSLSCLTRCPITDSSPPIGLSNSPS